VPPDLLADLRRYKPAIVARLRDAHADSLDVTFRLITTTSETLSILGSLNGLYGLDTETTGLDPLTHRVRLVQVAPADGGDVIVVDCFRVPLEIIRPVLDALDAVAHNAIFDQRMLRRRRPLECTLLLNHTLTGSAESLATLAERHLGRTLPKEAQTADWSLPLTDEMLVYAARDARAVLDLWRVLEPIVAREGARRVYELARDAQAVVAEMMDCGVGFDVGAHRAIVAEATARRGELLPELAAAGLKNPRSPVELARLLEKYADALWPRTPRGQLATSAPVLRSRGPSLDAQAGRVLECLLEYREADKLVTTYGDTFTEHVRPATGRIHPTLWIPGAATGRMSCREPKLQNIPRAETFRACFRAPAGRRLVVADFGQIGLRVAAIVAGEERLLEAFHAGTDVHRLTASKLLEKVASDVTKAERQLAKAINFGLLYGQGARQLAAYAAASYGVKMSVEKAQRFREAWFRAYPAIGRWQRQQTNQTAVTRRVCTPGGRVRTFPAGERTYTRSLNTPIQGGAAEVMLAALGRLDLDGLDAFPALVVHDELVLEAADRNVEAAASRLVAAMTAGYLDVFPAGPTTALAEIGIGQTWAEAKP